jgi:hypothetical protein
MSSSNDLAVEGNMYFLSRDEKYLQEKPYTLRYAPDDGFPQTNIDRTEYNIKFHNMRAEPNLFYNRCGFKVANLQSQMRYEDYDDENKVDSIHGPEVAECVKQALKASSAEVLDHVVSSLSVELFFSRYHLKEFAGTAETPRVANCYWGHVRLSATSITGSHRLFNVPSIVINSLSSNFLQIILTRRDAKSFAIFMEERPMLSFKVGGSA